MRQSRRIYEICDWRITTSPCSGAHVEAKYLVDFDPALTEIVTETKYMEQLGFPVPELARNVALQVNLYVLHIKTVHILSNL